MSEFRIEGETNIFFICMHVYYSVVDLQNESSLLVVLSELYRISPSG